MKKLGCAKCGKVVKSLPKAQKGKINKDPFAPQVISTKKGGKEKIVESRPKNDRGDNYENYRAGNKDKWGRSTSSKWYGFNPETKKFEYQKKGGSTTRLETRIPSGVTGPNMTPRVMQKNGFFSPEARAARKDKRAQKREDRITKKLVKSVMSSGKIIKAKRGGIKK